MLVTALHVPGNVGHHGPANFVVIASALPADPEAKAEVLMEDATKYQEAEGIRRPRSAIPACRSRHHLTRTRAAGSQCLQS